MEKLLKENSIILYSGEKMATARVQRSVPSDIEDICRFLRVTEHDSLIISILVRSGQSAVARIDGKVIGHHSIGVDRINGTSNVGLNQIDFLATTLRADLDVAQLRQELERKVKKEPTA